MVGNDGLISTQEAARRRNLGSGPWCPPPCVHTLAARVKAFDNIVCVYGVKSNKDAKVLISICRSRTSSVAPPSAKLGAGWWEY